MNTQRKSALERVLIRKIESLVNDIRCEITAKRNELERDEIYGNTNLAILDFDEFHICIYKDTYERYDRILSGCEKVIENIRDAKDVAYLMKKLHVKTLSYFKLSKLLCRIKNVY